MALFFLDGQEFKRGVGGAEGEVHHDLCLDSKKPGLEEASRLRQREICRVRDELEYYAGTIPALDRWVANDAFRTRGAKKAIGRDSIFSALVSRSTVACEPGDDLTPTRNSAFPFTSIHLY